ncbi:MAG: hypothetical protein AAGJ28_04260 [Pseudomonadota bacterium]
MTSASPSTLVLCLIIYAAGSLWVIGLLWLTVLKFSGWMVLERPAWLFGTVQRAMAIVFASAMALFIFDRALHVSGFL